MNNIIPIKKKIPYFIIYRFTYFEIYNIRFKFIKQKLKKKYTSITYLGLEMQLFVNVL